MSKIKPSTVKRNNSIIYNNIISKCALLGYSSDVKASKKIGMPLSTFSKRKKLGKWNSDELSLAAEALKVTLPWLVTDHSKAEEVNS